MRELSAAAQDALSEEHCQSLGMGICETANACWRSDARVQRSAQVVGTGHLEAALARGAGAILIGGRFTTAEIAARIISTRTTLNVLYRQPRNALLAHIIMRRLSRFENLVAHDDYRGLIDALDRGEAVWYPFGGYDLGEGATAIHSGSNCVAAQTPVVQLARSSGASVLPCFAERLPGTRGYCIEIGPAFCALSPSEEIPVATRLGALIDAHIHRVPEQYSWA
jgi:KDO2-lipid IV(A) lauroyltransferase